MKTVCLAPAAKGVAANPSLKLTVSCSSKVGIQLSHGTPKPKVSGTILFRVVCVCERAPSFNCFFLLGFPFQPVHKPAPTLCGQVAVRAPLKKAHRGCVFYLLPLSMIASALC